MGIMIEISKKDLKKIDKEIGKYKRGFCYIPEDLSGTVLLLKHENAAKHEYFVPNLSTSIALPMVHAIFEFLRQEEKRKKVIIGGCEFLVEDSMYEIRKKLINII